MKYLKLLFFSCSLFVCILGTSHAAYAAEEWRQFRHDWYRTAATSEELRNNGQGNNNAFTQIWSKEFEEWPHENANMTVVDGILYYSLMDGTIRAINATANSYQELWNLNTGASLNNSPAVYDGRVYLVNLKGRVMALDAQTGQIIWEFTVPTNVSSSPLYVNGRIFFGGIDGVLYAFDAENGQQGPVWTFKTPFGMIDTSPVYHKNKIIFSSENMHAYALDWKNGNVVWDVTIAGDKTWNGSPVVIRNADRVVFQTLSSYIPYINNGSTYRDVCDNCPGGYDVGSDPASDTQVLDAFNDFIGDNRPWVNTNVVLNTENGQEVNNFRYGTTPYSYIPFTSMYWSSIRWAVIDHHTLYAEGSRRQWTVNMLTGEIKRLNNYSSPGQYAYYVRGDENVLSIISGRRVIGGIRKNLVALDVDTGQRFQLQGYYADEQHDQTHIKERTYSSPHYQNHPGDGYTGANSEIIPYRDRAFYVDNGWLFALRPNSGSVTDINTDTTSPSTPTNLQASGTGNKVQLTWNAATDNRGVNSYRVIRNGVQIATTHSPEYIDEAAPSGNLAYQITALDWAENQSTSSTQVTIHFSGGGSPTPSICQQTDINQDQVVDISDYSILVANFLRMPLTNPRADIDQDGIADITDYSMLVAHFLQNCS